MIVAAFTGYIILQAAVGIVVLARIALKQADRRQSVFPIFSLMTALLIGLFCLVTVASSLSGQSSASQVTGAAIFLTALFAFLAFSSSSFLTHLADRIERKRKLKRWSKISISIALTIWLGTMMASISGFAKSAFFVAGVADYSVADEGYGYISEQKKEVVRKANLALAACQTAIDAVSKQPAGVSFQIRDGSLLASLGGENDYDAYVRGKLWPPLSIRSSFVSGKSGTFIIRSLWFDAGIQGKCFGEASNINLRNGNITSVQTITDLFSTSFINIKDNFQRTQNTAIPWYAFGANEAISELNFKIFETQPMNQAARILDFIIFWTSKVLIIYIIAFFLKRIKNDFA